jgi:hypothetical protein
VHKTYILPNVFIKEKVNSSYCGKGGRFVGTSKVAEEVGFATV